MIAKSYRNLFCSITCLVIASIISSANGQTFDFNNNTAFDGGQGIGTEMTAGSVTASIVDLFAPEFVDDGTGTFMQTENILRASEGDAVLADIGTSNSLGVDNPSIEDIDFFMDTGVELRDLNDGEGIVIEFDVPVVFTELDFQSLDDGMVTVTIEGIGSFDFEDAPSDVFANPFGVVLIPAGADITFSMSAPETEPAASARISQFTVATSLEDVSFDFNTGTEFDEDQGIGTTMTASSLDGNSTVTVELVDLFAPEFVDDGTGTFVPTENILTASGGDLVTSDIGTSALGVNNPSVSDDDFFMGAGIETRDINDREGLVIEFDQDVIITEIDFASLDDGTVTIAIDGGSSFDFIADDENNPTDTFAFPVGTGFIPAGSDITISLSSPTALDGTVRISEIVVSTSTVSLEGDFDGNGMVDCDDLDSYIGILNSPAEGDLADFDLDTNGTIEQDDVDLHLTLIQTSNDFVGTFLGDFDCNGTVDVLGDAFILVGSLGSDVSSYSDGDATFDGTVDVLGDAFVLVGNLGMSNN